MHVSLPAKTAAATAENVAALKAGLTSVIAGHPLAEEDWTFYEVLDEYLGPWGANGYPIGYGKFYCVAFNSSEKLNDNPTARGWVRETTVLLQTLLRDYVVERFQAGMLGSLTEAELRKFAFDSHPQAYTEGGLAMVALVEPVLISVIVSIPGKEFHPQSPDFDATVRQTFITIGRVAPQVVGGAIVSLVPPAHSGRWRNAIARDRDVLMHEMQLAQQLENLAAAVEKTGLEDIGRLDVVIEQLRMTRFPNRAMAQRAREVLQAAVERRKYLRQFQIRLLNECAEAHPDVREALEEQLQPSAPRPPAPAPPPVDPPVRGAARHPTGAACKPGRGAAAIER